ncbi:MAG: putative selenium-dependent hydroxylase accessory protein YqeC [Desulfobacterales bacterium]|nr:putative selenium-dependent hydroxylase accessory protein YqeC [Desulfobacterales bacterium]
MKLSRTINLNLTRVITVVGGGGKTSFIFTLAKEAAALGKSVLITTTTAMFNPEYFDSLSPESGGPAQPFDQIYIGPAEPLAARHREPGNILVAADAHNPKRKKLIGYTPEDLAAVLDSPGFDLILIEGDGARMRPVKAPAGHEPVIPPQTDMLVGCIGLDCLGRPLDETHVHRPGLLAEITGQAQGDPITEQTLVRLAESDQGLFKSSAKGMTGTIILNKADTPGRVQQGAAVAAQCRGKTRAGLCLITSFMDAGNPVKQSISL